MKGLVNSEGIGPSLLAAQISGAPLASISEIADVIVDGIYVVAAIRSMFIAKTTWHEQGKYVRD